MNVCMVAYTFYEADGRVRRYAESLAQRGDTVEAIALRRPGQPASEVVRGVAVHRIQERVIDERGPLSYLIKLLLFFLRSSTLLARRHLAAPYQVIHVHSVPDFQVFASLVPRLAGARIILDIHDIVPEFYASKFHVSERSVIFQLLLAAERFSICFAHHVIIANHLWREKLIRRSVRPEKCTANVNYPDLSIFHAREVKPEYPGRFVLCYPGTLNWHQGLDVAIRAMSLVRSQAPHALLLIIGDGPERENLKRLIREGGLEDVVVMRGLVPIEQVAEMMASVDLGIVPKRSNSFGNEAFSTKIMEFMAMGVPVLASRTRIDEYYFNGGFVEFFESGDIDGLSSKILDLMSDSRKRTALSQKGLEFIGQNNWDVKKGDYLRLVDGLASVVRPK